MNRRGRALARALRASPRLALAQAIHLSSRLCASAHRLHRRRRADAVATLSQPRELAPRRLRSLRGLNRRRRALARDRRAATLRLRARRPRSLRGLNRHRGEDARAAFARLLNPRAIRRASEALLNHHARVASRAQRPRPHARRRGSDAALYPRRRGDLQIPHLPARHDLADRDEPAPRGLNRRRRRSPRVALGASSRRLAPRRASSRGVLHARCGARSDALALRHRRAPRALHRPRRGVLLSKRRDRDASDAPAVPRLYPRRGVVLREEEGRREENVGRRVVVVEKPEPRADAVEPAVEPAGGFVPVVVVENLHLFLFAFFVVFVVVVVVALGDPRRGRGRGLGLAADDFVDAREGLPGERHRLRSHSASASSRHVRDIIHRGGRRGDVGVLVHTGPHTTPFAW